MKTIAVVCGGYSKEEIISLKSAAQIEQSIDASKYVVYKVLINKETWVVKSFGEDIHVDKNDFSFKLNGNKIIFDAVFMAIHGTPGEDGKLQSYFEMIGIPMTTCSAFVSALTFNKFISKLYLMKFGIVSAKDVLLRRDMEYNTDTIKEELGLPIFVKPNNGGSSFGISKVNDSSGLTYAIEKAFGEDDEVIVEEYIEGREFTCGGFISDEEEIVFPVTEIVSKTDFFDFEAKYGGLADEITPAQISKELTNKCQKLTLDIYKALKCTGLVRIDFLLRKNIFYFMEVNTVPGMSKESIIPQQVAAYGMSAVEFSSKLLKDALSRG